MHQSLSVRPAPNIILKTMQPLRVTLFSDGRPGHEKQSLGILEALQNYCAVEVERVAIAPGSLLVDIIDHLGYLFRRGRRPSPGGRQDLLIGTGSRTHLPMLSLKRKNSARAVTCMSPMVLLRNDFDLCFVPLHDRIRDAENIFRTIGPPNIATPFSAPDQSRGLILVGGEDERSHIWEDKRIVADISQLMQDNMAVDWTISSSPRTPEATEELLKELVLGRTGVRFIPFSETGPGWVEEQYCRNGQVWITGDSISMVYEALSAGCRVGVLEVCWKRHNNKFSRSLEYLIAEQRLVTFSQYREGRARWAEHAPLNEADRCAREILRRWWPKNLP
jgi:mitochondrial fission protein ELM1